VLEEFENFQCYLNGETFQHYRKNKTEKYSQFWAYSLAIGQENVIFFSEGVTVHFGVKTVAEVSN
jgi:hypothetical protein